MAVERKLGAVGPIPFTSNGTDGGLVTVASTKGFKVKAQVTVSANALPNLQLEVKEVISKTQMIVGDRGSMEKKANLSLYTTAANATIFQFKQDRPQVPKEDQDRATYEQEPTLARRVILVDGLGNPIDEDNPLPIDLDSVTFDGDVHVQLTDKESSPGAKDYDITRVGNGENELDIEDDGSALVTPVTVIKTPTITNIPAENANTQYVMTVPVTAKKFYFKNRGLGKLQVSFITGETNTNFFSLASGVVYGEDNLKLTSPLLIYFQNSKPNEVIELLTWE